MKRLYSLFFFSLFVHITNAQNLTLATSGDIIKHDSLCGYFFVLQDASFSKKEDKYFIEFYNESFHKTDEMEFTTEKEMEILSDGINFTGDYMTFFMRNALSGEAETEALLASVGISQPRKNINIILNLKTKKRELVDFTSKKIFFVGENRIIEQEAKGLKIYDGNFNLIRTIEQNITPSHVVDDSLFFSNAMGITKFFSGINGNFLFDDSQFCDIKGDKKYLLTRTFSTGNGTYIGAGDFGDLRREMVKGAGGIRPIMNRMYKYGFYFQDIDIKDNKTPIKNRKNFLYSDVFGKYIKLNKDGSVDSDLGVQFINLVTIGDKIRVLALFSFKREGDFNFNTLNLSGDIKSSNFNDIRGYICPKATSDDVEFPIVNNLFLLEFDKNLNLLKTLPITLPKSGELKSYSDKKLLSSQLRIEYNSDVDSYCITALSQGFSGSVIKLDNKGKLLVDELKIQSKATAYGFYFSKAGFMTIVEYFKKEKKLERRIEKLNFHSLEPK